MPGRAEPSFESYGRTGSLVPPVRRVVMMEAWSTRSQRVSEYDSPWKEALERFLPQFLDFFFSDVFQGVDWSRGYESLDKELQQIVREAELGLRLADKLFKVWRLDGEEATSALRH
jgi:hypothetical protein